MLEMNKPGVGSRGFTLIELLATLTIIAIAMAIAVPSLSTFQRNAELTSTANNLQASINTARSEAMKRGMNAMVKPVDSTDWTKGWVVFVDVARDGDASNASNIQIAAQEPLPSYLTVSGGFAVKFDASGFAMGTTGPVHAPNGTFTIQRNDTSSAEQWTQTRRVVISLAGRVRTCKPKTASDADCS
jgi:type IV fimbrial biogenesis protein FimT